MDELKPLTDAELTACVHLAEELSSNLLQQGNVANAQSIVADMQRLVGQVRRLRAGKWLDRHLIVQPAGDDRGHA